MAKWIILAVIVVLVGLFGITYLYDNSLRAGILLLGELSLKDSYKHYLEHGQPTNYASSYQVNLVLACADKRYNDFDRIRLFSGESQRFPYNAYFCH